MKRQFRSNCLIEALKQAKEGIYVVFPWEYPRGLHFFWKAQGRYFDFCGKLRGNLLARLLFYFRGQVRELSASHELVRKGRRLF
ncbi:MAG: hypothetical protein HKM05_07415 [Spirochaetales bacterium]|nr:hypothetical protein [Spirochaetales bacterium]